MERYIKLDDAITTLRKYFPLSFDRQDAEDDLKSIPAADVEEVRHGEWMRYSPLQNPWCSECKVFESSGIEKNYCSNCGAKMERR